MERRLNVAIPEATFRRLKAWAALEGKEMPQATAAALEAGLDAVGAPAVTSAPDEGKKQGLVYGTPGRNNLALADHG